MTSQVLVDWLVSDVGIELDQLSSADDRSRIPESSELDLSEMFCNGYLLGCVLASLNVGGMTTEHLSKHFRDTDDNVEKISHNFETAAFFLGEAGLTVKPKLLQDVARGLKGGIDRLLYDIRRHIQTRVRESKLGVTGDTTSQFTRALQSRDLSRTQVTDENEAPMTSRQGTSAGQFSSGRLGRLDTRGGGGTYSATIEHSHNPYSSPTKKRKTEFEALQMRHVQQKVRAVVTEKYLSRAELLFEKFTQHADQLEYDAWLDKMESEAIQKQREEFRRQDLRAAHQKMIEDRERKEAEGRVKWVKNLLVKHAREDYTDRAINREKHAKQQRQQAHKQALNQETLDCLSEFETILSQTQPTAEKSTLSGVSDEQPSADITTQSAFITDINDNNNDDNQQPLTMGEETTASLTVDDMNQTLMNDASLLDIEKEDEQSMDETHKHLKYLQSKLPLDIGSKKASEQYLSQVKDRVNRQKQEQMDRRRELKQTISDQLKKSQNEYNQKREEIMQDIFATSNQSKPVRMFKQRMKRIAEKPKEFEEHNEFQQNKTQIQKNMVNDFSMSAGMGSLRTLIQTSKDIMISSSSNVVKKLTDLENNREEKDMMDFYFGQIIGCEDQMKSMKDINECIPDRLFQMWSAQSGTMIIDESQREYLASSSKDEAMRQFCDMHWYAQGKGMWAHYPESLSQDEIDTLREKHQIYEITFNEDKDGADEKDDTMDGDNMNDEGKSKDEGQSGPLVTTITQEIGVQTELMNDDNKNNETMAEKDSQSKSTKETISSTKEKNKKGDTSNKKESSSKKGSKDKSGDNSTKKGTKGNKKDTSKKDNNKTSDETDNQEEKEEEPPFKEQYTCTSTDIEGTGWVMGRKKIITNHHLNNNNVDDPSSDDFFFFNSVLCKQKNHVCDFDLTSFITNKEIMQVKQSRSLTLKETSSNAICAIVQEIFQVSLEPDPSTLKILPLEPVNIAVIGKKLTGKSTITKYLSEKYALMLVDPLQWKNKAVKSWQIKQETMIETNTQPNIADNNNKEEEDPNGEITQKEKEEKEEECKLSTLERIGKQIFEIENPIIDESSIAAETDTNDDSLADASQSGKPNNEQQQQQQPVVTIPSEVWVELMVFAVMQEEKQRISKRTNGCLFDGFPQNVKEAELFEQKMSELKNAKQSINDASVDANGKSAAASKDSKSSDSKKKKKDAGKKSKSGKDAASSSSSSAASDQKSFIDGVFCLDTFTKQDQNQEEEEEQNAAEKTDSADKHEVEAQEQNDDQQQVNPDSVLYQRAGIPFPAPKPEPVVADGDEEEAAETAAKDQIAEDEGDQVEHPESQKLLEPMEVTIKRDNFTAKLEEFNSEIKPSLMDFFKDITHQSIWFDLDCEMDIKQSTLKITNHIDESSKMKRSEIEEQQKKLDEQAQMELDKMPSQDHHAQTGTLETLRSKPLSDWNQCFTLFRQWKFINGNFIHNIQNHFQEFNLFCSDIHQFYLKCKQSFHQIIGQSDPIISQMIVLFNKEFNQLSDKQRSDPDIKDDWWKKADDLNYKLFREIIRLKDNHIAKMMQLIHPDIIQEKKQRLNSLIFKLSQTETSRVFKTCVFIFEYFSNRLELSSMIDESPNVPLIKEQNDSTETESEKNPDAEVETQEQEKPQRVNREEIKSIFNQLIKKMDDNSEDISADNETIDWMRSIIKDEVTSSVLKLEDLKQREIQTQQRSVFDINEEYSIYQGELTTLTLKYITFSRMKHEITSWMDQKQEDMTAMLDGWMSLSVVSRDVAAEKLVEQIKHCIRYQLPSITFPVTCTDNRNSTMMIQNNNNDNNTGVIEMSEDGGMHLKLRNQLVTEYLSHRCLPFPWQQWWNDRSSSCITASIPAQCTVVFLNELAKKLKCDPLFGYTTTFSIKMAAKKCFDHFQSSKGTTTTTTISNSSSFSDCEMLMKFLIDEAQQCQIVGDPCMINWRLMLIRIMLRKIFQITKISVIPSSLTLCETQETFDRVSSSDDDQSNGKLTQTQFFTMTKLWFEKLLFSDDDNDDNGGGESRTTMINNKNNSWKQLIWTMFTEEEEEEEEEDVEEGRGDNTGFDYQTFLLHCCFNDIEETGMSKVLSVLRHTPFVDGNVDKISKLEIETMKQRQIFIEDGGSITTMGETFTISELKETLIESFELGL